jgi:NAD(P)-dependent dehydrogenase (short-subunit alcohol dehydrogenase family)
MSPRGRALVTGGGSGLGLGIAEVLRARGYDVVLTGRREAPLRAAAERLGAEALVADITDDPAGLIAQATLGGPLTHLVHNAGHYEHLPIGDWTAEAWDRLLRVHLVAPALLTRAFAAQARGPGAIVHIGSTLSERPIPGSGPYAAAKAGALGLVRALAVELAPQGIRANAILPGVVLTEMTAAPRGDEADPAARLDAVARAHLAGRLGTPTELGEAVAFLLEAPWITGAALPVDGGLLLG